MVTHAASSVHLLAIAMAIILAIQIAAIVLPIYDNHAGNVLDGSPPDARDNRGWFSTSTLVYAIGITSAIILMVTCCLCSRTDRSTKK